MRSGSPPFGMPMPGRSNSTTAYRYGFNTQEKDDEICGAGNTNTAMFWEYSTRLGRRWNLDPKPQIGISDYAAFANNPIIFNDLLGDVWGKPGDKPNNKDKKQADKNLPGYSRCHGTL